MTAANFPACLQIILREEGGNDDDPRDRGGRTSRGIIQREWDAYRETHPKLPADVWKAPQKDINAIYRNQYWNPYCDDLPAGIDLCFFNASVNSGRQQAVKEVQRALGTRVDGMMGVVTIAAIKEYPDFQLLIHKISEQRRAFYRMLRQFPIYGRGWMARTDRIEAAAKAMAPAFTGPMARAKPDDDEDMASTTSMSAKAKPDDMATPPMSVETASASTAGSAVSTGVVDQVQTVTSQLSPLQDVFWWVKIALVVLAVICAGFTVYAVIHNRRIKDVT